MTVILKMSKILTLNHNDRSRRLLEPKDRIKAFRASMFRDPRVLLRKWIAQGNKAPIPDNAAYFLQEKSMIQRIHTSRCSGTGKERE